MLIKFEELHNDQHAFNLMSEISNISPVIHPFRGYAILNSDSPLKDIQVFNNKKILFRMNPEMLIIITLKNRRLGTAGLEPSSSYSLNSYIMRDHCERFAQ